MGLEGSSKIAHIDQRYMGLIEVVFNSKEKIVIKLENIFAVGLLNSTITIHSSGFDDYFVLLAEDEKQATMFYDQIISYIADFTE